MSLPPVRRVLVTGGTGFVGREVVRQLVEAGFLVRLLVRRPDKARLLQEKYGVELVVGDALQPESLPPALAGVDAVVHLIGIIKETSHVTFEQAHLEATQNLLAAAEQAGVARWLQMSALGTRPQARSRYHQTKWAAEEAVRASRLAWTIFRPSLIYGDDRSDRLLNGLRLVFSFPGRFLTLGLVPVLDGGTTRVQPVSRREVALCFTRALAQPVSIGQTYDLVGPQPLTVVELIREIALGLRLRSWFSHYLLLISLAGCLRFLAIVVSIYSLLFSLTAFRDEQIPLFFNLILIPLAGGYLLVATRILLLFSFPSAPLTWLARLADRFLPRSLRFGEQLKMVLEDNTGDPVPATRDFAYTPESFTRGVVRLYAR